jgi:hypothetical protein
METESGAKIAIRGKGSVKEGKGRSDAAHTSNQEEDLHCLIMADTEEKVNKAKKLIHNIIETVSPLVPFSQFFLLFPTKSSSNHHRLHRFLKARTSSSETNFVSLQHSTVLSEMMRTKLARIADKSVTGSTIVQSSATSQPTSSVASVEMQDIWREIARIGMDIVATVDR